MCDVCLETRLDSAKLLLFFALFHRCSLLLGFLFLTLLTPQTDSVLDMAVAVASLGKTLAAVVAREWPELQVGAQMISRVAHLEEFVIAEDASEHLI